MDFQLPIANWRGHVREVTIGSNNPFNKRSRRSVTVGGETSLPFHGFEGKFPHKPVIAWEILDCRPSDWPDQLLSTYGDLMDDPISWAKHCENNGADMVCITLRGSDPEGLNRDINETVDIVKSIVQEISIPVILKGFGPPEHQADILSKCAETVENTNCLLASADEHNYKTVVAAAIAFGHALVAETPIDVNLAKQLNILITDMNFPPEKIIIDPLTGGLGYGLEYTYSVMERIRLQALNGDSMMQMPIICFVGDEAWRVKEVRVGEDKKPDWGPLKNRAILWEITTAMPLLLAGADILVMRHPEAIETIQHAVGNLTCNEK